MIVAMDGLWRPRPAHPSSQAAPPTILGLQFTVFGAQLTTNENTQSAGRDFRNTRPNQIIMVNISCMKTPIYSKSRKDDDPTAAVAGRGRRVARV